jgi:hypothetical protein
MVVLLDGKDPSRVSRMRVEVGVVDFDVSFDDGFGSSGFRV